MIKYRFVTGLIATFWTLLLVAAVVCVGDAINHLRIWRADKIRNAPIITVNHIPLP